MFNPWRRKANQQRLLGVAPSHAGWSAALVETRAQSFHLQWANHVAQTTRGEVPTALVPRAARGERCSSLLTTQDYSLVLVDAPDVPPAEIRAAVRWRVNEMIDFHVDDAVIDIFDLPTLEGRTPRLYAVAARNTAVRQLSTDITDAGLNLETIDIPEFALRNITSALPEDQHGVALIALEAQRGILTLTRQGNVFLSRRLDYGFERLLHTSDDGLNEGALDTLVIEIQRSLDYYERHFSQPAIQTMVFAPLPAELGLAGEYLQSQLGLNVRELDLNTVLQCTEPLARALQAQCFTAIGAAMRTDEVLL